MGNIVRLTGVIKGKRYGRIRFGSTRFFRSGHLTRLKPFQPTIRFRTVVFHQGNTSTYHSSICCKYILLFKMWKNAYLLNNIFFYTLGFKPATVMFIVEELTHNRMYDYHAMWVDLCYNTMAVPKLQIVTLNFPQIFKKSYLILNIASCTWKQHSGHFFDPPLLI